MSSSDETFGWPAIRERAVPAPAELLSPSAELGAALQRCWQQLDRERARTREVAADADAAAAEHAVLLHRFGIVLRDNEDALTAAGLGGVQRQLRILRDQMLAALKETGLEIVDPVGRPFDEVADAVRVLYWRNEPEFSSQVVAETIEPIVRHGVETVRPGRVIGGAPAAGSGPGEETE